MTKCCLAIVTIPQQSRFTLSVLLPTQKWLPTKSGLIAHDANTLNGLIALRRDMGFTLS